MMTARISELYTPGDPESYETVKTVKGKELVGKTYTPLFPYFVKTVPKAFQVLKININHHHHHHHHHRDL